jgi:hypothetical protein
VIAASLLLAGCAAEQPSSPEAQYASEVCGDPADAGDGPMCDSSGCAG